MNKHEIAPLLYGTDANKETSIFEYGLLVAPYLKDGKTDEYFCLHHIGNDRYDVSYKQESELNNLINGKDWANDRDIQSFLSFVGLDKSEWLKTQFVQKLQDCLRYWGYENVLGSSYYEGLTKEEVIAKYL